MGEAAAADVVREVTARRSPIVLTRSPVLRWAAIASERWHPRELAAHAALAGGLPSVYTHSDRLFKWHDPNRLLGRRLGLRLADAHTTAHGVRAADFFGERPDSAAFMYLSQDILEPPWAPLSDDAQPRAFLAATNGTGGASTAGVPHVSVLWAGAAGITAGTHYDPTHTLFSQTFGTKRFELWPPEAWPSIRLHPHGHPAYRQARTSSAPPSAEGAARAWLRRLRQAIGVDGRDPDLPPPAMEATLGVGDVLYVPPFWFHRVTSISFSTALSVVTDSPEGDRFENACRAGLPHALLSPGSPLSARLRAAQRFLAAVVDATGEAPAPVYVRRALIEGRFGGELAEPLRCGAPAERAAADGECSVGEDARPRPEEAAVAARVAAALLPPPATPVTSNSATSTPLDGVLDGVGHILLQDYVEYVAGFVAGPGAMCGWLRRCVAAPGPV